MMCVLKPVGICGCPGNNDFKDVVTKPKVGSAVRLIDDLIFNRWRFDTPYG